MFVDRPREFVVQLPRHDDHEHGAHSNDAGDNNEERLRLIPYILVNVAVDRQDRNRILDLLHLDRPVYQKSNITKAYPDDLDRVLQTERIVHEDQLINETKAVQGQEGRNGFRRGDIVRLGLELYLEVREDVTAAYQHQHQHQPVNRSKPTFQDPGLLSSGPSQR